MKTLLYVFSLLLGGCLASCSITSEQAIEDTWTPVAEWKVVEGDSVMVADVNKAEVETTLPLEMIADDYQVIKLDKEAEEYSILSDAFITEGYIGISNYSNEPFRLFKKDGTFLRQIGALGEEENGKYRVVSNAQIDEANNRIYIMPENIKEVPMSKRKIERKAPILLAYDLKGNFLHEIPLVCWVGFGSSFKVDAQKGEIIAIGNPLGSLGGTVTCGNVSALNRAVTIGGKEMVGLVQLSCSLNPGDSGGGIFDMYGALVGIVNARGAGEYGVNIGFATPISDAIKIGTDLIRNGFVTGRVDTEVFDIREISNSQTTPAGLYFMGVNNEDVHTTLVRNDLIVSVSGVAISTTSEWEAVLNSKNVGDTVEIVYRRQGVEGTVRMVLTNRTDCD